MDRLAATATARATHVEQWGEWLVRVDPEVSFRRSNSTVPLAGGAPFDVEARIDQVVDVYRRRGLSPRFQIVPAADPADLDDRLARRGFVVEAPVDVLVSPLTSVGAMRVDPSLAVRVAPNVDLAWAEPFGEEGSAHARIRGYSELLEGIAPAHAVAMADIGGEPAALGVGVVDDGWLGVFGMVTRQSLRRRGAARAVLRALALEAAESGATRAYLQLEVRNDAARRLYCSAGFTRSHGYRYRTLH